MRFFFSFSLSLFALLLQPSPAQAQNSSNLLRWNAWQKVNGQYLKQVKITKTHLYFVPYYNNGFQKKTTGWKQVFTVPQAGYYQLHFRGVGGLTGKFNLQISLGGSTRFLSADNWKISKTYFLKKGSQTLTILSDTSNLLADSMIWEQPQILPVTRPTIEVDRLDFGSLGAKLILETKSGNIILMGLRPLKKALSIPGFGLGLLLDPKSQIFLLGSTTTPPLRLFFAREVKVLKSIPKVYFQALSLKPAQLGSLTWVQYKNL
ncbi:MAG TPA: hypothetical protein ENK02_04625 [Planctomycetes bacterium]|nr:hypothetical protein [Planctomycetota bacterium]